MDRQQPALACALHQHQHQHHHLTSPDPLSLYYDKHLQSPGPSSFRLSHYHDPTPASLPPTGLPLLQHHRLRSQQQQAADALQTPSNLTAVGAAPYDHPSLHIINPSPTRPHRTRAQSRRAQHQCAQPLHQPQLSSHPLRQSLPMDTLEPGMHDDELAELQKASNEYEPEVTGPLVGQRQPSIGIVAEYASADPVYQVKTAALPQKYSHYRTVRGDGKCGWRAVAFGYFETLLRQHDAGIFGTEEARLRSLNNVMQQAGENLELCEDFANETFELLRTIGKALSVGNADSVLLDTFNDDYTQNFIITHLRTLTSSWMKTHEENYAPWLLGQTVDQYCANQVMPIAAEIDHVGLMALKDVLLSPASMTLEVLYLDRSEGSEVTMHRFDPVSNACYSVGSVRLLYRPGHYDLLYKPEDITPPAPAVPAPTYVQYASHIHQAISELGLPDFAALIPGMSYAPNYQNSWISSPYDGGSDFLGADTCAPTPFSPHLPPLPVYPPVGTTMHMNPPDTQTVHSLPIRTGLVQVPMISPIEFQPQIGVAFRPSVWELEPEFVTAMSSTPFQTAIMRNSHFNQAHFLNPDFQPEQWDPHDEYAPTPGYKDR